MKRFLAKDSSEIYYINDYDGHANYKIVYVLLLILMFITIIPELVNSLYGYEIIPHSNLVIFLIFSLSTIKALLVVFKFMHIQYEHRLLLASFISCIFLIFIIYALLFMDVAKLNYANYFFTDYYDFHTNDVKFHLDLEKIKKHLEH